MGVRPAAGPCPDLAPDPASPSGRASDDFVQPGDLLDSLSRQTGKGLPLERDGLVDCLTEADDLPDLLAGPHEQHYHQF